jgi:hypothetical protein
VSILVVDKRVLLDLKDSSEITPLLYAIKTSNLPIVELLLLHGARPDICDERGKSPICYAREIQDTNIRTKVLNMLDYRLRVIRSQELRSIYKLSECLGPRACEICNIDPGSKIYLAIKEALFELDVSALRALVSLPSTPINLGFGIRDVKTENLITLLISKIILLHFNYEELPKIIELLDVIYKTGIDFNSICDQEEDGGLLHLVISKASRFCKFDEISFAYSESQTGRIIGYNRTCGEFCSVLIEKFKVIPTARDSASRTFIHMAAEYNYSKHFFYALLEHSVTNSLLGKAFESVDRRGCTPIDSTVDISVKEAIREGIRMISLDPWTEVQQGQGNLTNPYTKLENLRNAWQKFNQACRELDSWNSEYKPILDEVSFCLKRGQMIKPQFSQRLRSGLDKIGILETSLTIALEKYSQFSEKVREACTKAKEALDPLEQLEMELLEESYKYGPAREQNLTPSLNTSIQTQNRRKPKVSFQVVPPSLSNSRFCVELSEKLASLSKWEHDSDRYTQGIVHKQSGWDNNNIKQVLAVVVKARKNCRKNTPLIISHVVRGALLFGKLKGDVRKTIQVSSFLC